MGKGELTLEAFQAGMQSDDTRRTVKVMRRFANALHQHYRQHHAQQQPQNGQQQPWQRGMQQNGGRGQLLPPQPQPQHLAAANR